LKARSKHADDYPTRQAVVKLVQASSTFGLAIVD